MRWHVYVCAAVRHITDACSKVKNCIVFFGRRPRPFDRHTRSMPLKALKRKKARTDAKRHRRTHMTCNMHAKFVVLHICQSQSGIHKFNYVACARSTYIVCVHVCPLRCSLVLSDVELDDRLLHVAARAKRTKAMPPHASRAIDRTSKNLT